MLSLIIPGNSLYQEFMSEYRPNERPSLSGNKSILWFSQPDGVFRQYLNLDAKVEFGYSVSRTTVISRLKRHNDQSKPITLCDLFILPHYISCLGFIDTSQCDAIATSRSELEKISQRDVSRICYTGPEITASKSPKREINLSSLFSSIPFHVAAKYQQLMQVANQELTTGPEGVTLNDSSNFSFIFAHWTRVMEHGEFCHRNNVDFSLGIMDCASIEDVVEGLAPFKDVNAIVYISTNDRSNNTLQMLRQEGFKTRLDFTNNSLLSLSDMEIGVVEMAMMLNADSFLGLGLNDVDDIVEYQRFKENKTYCANAIMSERGLDKDMKFSWCGSGMAPLDQHAHIEAGKWGRNSTYKMGHRQKRAPSIPDRAVYDSYGPNTTIGRRELVWMSDQDGLLSQVSFVVTSIVW